VDAIENSESFTARAAKLDPRTAVCSKGCCGEDFRLDVPPIGQRVAFINDDSGNVIEITQPGT
jgi:hypothetical protein